MENIETRDIQGIILKGYPDLPACTYLLAAVRNKNAAGQWLKEILPEITPGNAKPTEAALNIAFTYQGLKELGLSTETLDSFPLDLEDGMTTSHKQLFLGDFGSSDPVNWSWGGTRNEPVHVLLMIYAVNETVLNNLYIRHKQLLETHGQHEVKALSTSVLIKRKEHFGFRDGIAQPTIRGLARKDSPGNTVAAGEFILGYKNSYDQYPDTPVVKENDPASKILPESFEAGMRDLGRNGSYLIFRQMEQDVKLFWRYIEEITGKPGERNSHEMIKLAAKMVGRWPSGAPICLCPDKDDESMENKDSFAYRASDSLGLKCPVGSHIRRTNPRDSMDADIKASVVIANKHRILRRGRSYGKPVCESLDPEDILNSEDFEGERGLHFICFNSDISRQFEFIQNAWVNNPKLSNLYNERDPLIGNNYHPEDVKDKGVFSVPRNGLRRRYTDVPEFVIVKGGAYFFMPGLKALSYLSSL